ncbi:hypothetical protein OQN26_25505, partial [Citrobacter freundii]|uniref:hypothetical protein n=1 Tax=Citrobacter freundii TaxID=546 RepID=UPI00224C9463
LTNPATDHDQPLAGSDTPQECAPENLPESLSLGGATGSVLGAADGDPVGEGSAAGFAEEPAAFEAAEPVEALTAA